jgi:predicted dehydrogenase
MSEIAKQSGQGATNRRDFLKTGSAGVAAALTLAPGLSAQAFAGGDDVIKVGLIGCGGRGSGAASDALEADPGVRLFAMGDAFADDLDKSLQGLKAAYKDRVLVDDAHKFVGFDAYKHVVDCCDVVLLTTPPHFRPQHLKYAIEQGKHVFCEKPVAVDPHGVRSVIETCKLAEEKKLAVVSGLCWRYHPAVSAAFNEVRDGRIGDVVAARVSYFTRGLWVKPRQESWSDMEWQIRNWLYFTWLSGDHITEQHVHSLDKMVWAMGDKHPISATGTGGRFLRTDPIYGNVYDHFAIEYVFENNVTGFGRCRQQDPCLVDVSDTIYGTKGLLQVNSDRVRIMGEKPWRYDGEGGNMYRLEHVAMYKSIRAGQPINNGGYMCTSTLTAILGREAAYSGQSVKWDELLASDMRLGPQEYDWTSLPVPPVRKPGDGAEKAIA